MANNMHKQFNTSQVAAAFQVSLETVRIWCGEFERHLTPRANPGKRQKRAFSEEDMEVFALIAALKADGLTYQDIHMSLENGERGVVPVTLDSGSTALIERDAEKLLMVRIDSLETQLVEAETENERLKEELETIRRDSPASRGSCRNVAGATAKNGASPARIAG